MVTPELRLYSINEVAQLLSVSRRTVYDYLKRGDLVSVRLGADQRIKHGDLVRFIERLPKAS